MTLCHNDNWDNQPACRLIDGDPMSGSVRVNVELSSYILQKFGGCAACSPAKSSHTHIIFICHGRGDRSWVVYCWPVKSVGREGYSRVLLTWHVKQ